MTKLIEQLKASKEQLKTLEAFHLSNQKAMHEINGQIKLLEHMISCDECNCCCEVGND